MIEEKSMNFDGVDYIAVESEEVFSCTGCAFILRDDDCFDCTCPPSGMHWEVGMQYSEGAGI